MTLPKVYQITFTEKEIELLTLMCACSIGVIALLPKVASMTAIRITDMSTAEERSILAHKILKAFDPKENVSC